MALRHGYAGADADGAVTSAPHPPGVPAMHLVQSEILSVTTSIRKYSRGGGGGSGSSSGGGGGSSSSSSLASSSSSLAAFRLPGSPAYYAAVPAGSHAASLTGHIIAQARRGAGNEIDDAVSPASHLAATDDSLKSALSARAKDQAVGDGAARPTAAPSAPLPPPSAPAALLQGFSLLRAQLRDHAGGISTFPLSLLATPFLHVILSPRVSAPVTSAALQSIHRLLVYGVISLRGDSHAADDARRTVIDVARAVSLCKFEPSEPTVDELVLLRILGVMNQLVCGPGALADVLTDEGICEMMETGLSMCCQVRLTDLLRKTAEQSLLPMVRHIFGKRLPEADEDEGGDVDAAETTPDAAPKPHSEQPPPSSASAASLSSDTTTTTTADEKRLRRMTMPDPSGLGLNVQEDGQQQEEQPGDEGEVEAGGDDVNGGGGGGGNAQQDQQQEQSSVATTDVAAAAPAAAPAVAGAAPRTPTYSLPALKEILRVLISLLDPQSTSHTDSMRLLGLNLLTAVFETSGGQLTRLPSLRALVQDTGCKFLFQLARSDSSFAISSYASRAICTLFAGCKEDLKLQYELLLIWLFDRLAPTYALSEEPWQDAAATAGTTPSPAVTAAAPPAPPPPPPMPRSSDRAPASGDARDLALETLAMLTSDGGIVDLAAADPLLELFINYDCDVDCDDLFTRAVHFLCRSVFAGPRAGGAVTNGANSSGNGASSGGASASGGGYANSTGAGGASAATGQDAAQVFALDAVLTFVERLTDRQGDGDGDGDGEGDNDDDSAAAPPAWPPSLPPPSHLHASRLRKSSVLEGARRFNSKPRDGLAYLESQGFITTSSPHTIASFLLSCPRLDKKLLGDYLSRPANEDVLLAFIQLFDFTDKPLSEAMREMLESFRLPGESQQIARITETFSKVYFAAVDKSVIRSEDAVYVLAYSVIMLNTDLHNAQNKRKMKVDDYRRNLRGVNDGVDFDPDYLANIYENIRKREIVMPEEHVGQLGFDYAWKELLRKSRSGTRTRLQSPPPRTAQMDRAMFEASWQPIVACIAHAFSTFRDEHLLERAISGFRQCAMLASKWGMDEVFDFMIQGLAASTGLLDASSAVVAPPPRPGTVVEVEGARVTVSPLSVRFGLDFKGQLAAVVLFTIANGNGRAIRRGWTSIFEIFKNLFAAGLLPADMAAMFDADSETSPSSSSSSPSPSPSPPLTLIPLKPKKSTAPTPDPRTQAGAGGLFSTLSSYLLSPYSTPAEPAPPEVTHDDVESSLCTVDCISSCRVGELYSQLLALDDRDALITAVKSLRQLADRLTLGQLAAAAAANQQSTDGLPERTATPPASGVGGAMQRVVSAGSTASGRNSPQPDAAGGNAYASHALHRLPYDARSVFVLEVLTNVTCVAGHSSPEAWTEAFAHIAALLQSPRNFHSALLERAVVCLVRLIDVAGDGEGDAKAETSSAARVSSAVELLRSLPSDVRTTLSPALMASLRYVLSANADPPRRTPLLHSVEQWTDVLSIAQDSLSSRSSQAIALLYALVSTIATSPHLSSANFVPVVDVLRDVAQCADPEPMLLEINKRERQGYRLTLTEKKEITEYVEVCRAKSVEAIKRLEEVRGAIAAIAGEREGGDGNTAGFARYYLTLTSALASQCTNTHKATRNAALTSLSRVLFSDAHGADAHSPSTTRQIFLTCLFPVLDALLNPRIFSRETDAAAAGGLIDTRIKASTLLCNALCSYVTLLREMRGEEVQEIWRVSLDLIERMAGASSKSSPSFMEATKENLKKVLLVFASAELLAPPVASGGENGENAADTDTRSPQQVALWVITLERLDKFLPGLVKATLAGGE